MLIPNFNLIQKELKERPNWVLLDNEKKPYISAVPNEHAKSNDPNTWSTFNDVKNAYLNGGFSGIAFVLDGQGIVGIDLDDCVVNGQPDEKALEILKRIGCNSYELSMSGSGLRAFGYCEEEPLKKRGYLNGISVELYSTKRYLSVTGHAIKTNPLNYLKGFIEVSKALEPKQITDKKDINENIVTKTEQLKEISLTDLPRNVFPQKFGQRTMCLFLLARYLQYLKPEEPVENFEYLLQNWYTYVLQNIRTKDYKITRYDFYHAWKSVKQPFNSKMSIAMSLKDNIKIPNFVNDLKYEDLSLEAFKVCAALHVYHRGEPFFISSRKAAEYINTNHSDAAKFLKILVNDKILSITKQNTRTKARWYKMNIEIELINE